LLSQVHFSKMRVTENKKLVRKKKKLLALVGGVAFFLFVNEGEGAGLLGVWEGNGIGLGILGLAWIYKLVCRGVGSRRCRGEEVLDGTRTA